MDTLAWKAQKKYRQSLRSGGCAGGCRARPGTRMRTLPEPEGKLASR
jgi:hypothetical protein